MNFQEDIKLNSEGFEKWVKKNRHIEKIFQVLTIEFPENKIESYQIDIHPISKEMFQK